jgi:hypothetical protein
VSKVERETIEQQLRAALRRIADLNPEYDSSEGHNEWGEAECFTKAQTIAREALQDNECEGGCHDGCPHD